MDWCVSIISRVAGADSETWQMSTGDRGSQPRRGRTTALEVAGLTNAGGFW